MNLLRKHKAKTDGFLKLIPISKVDELKHEIGGIVTAEQIDKAGEICDYESTKPYYKAWSDELAKATQGKNLGNLREMHQLTAVGVGKSIEFQDEQKQIFMTFKVVDDNAWNKIIEGCLNSFSHGGEYIKTWRDKDDNVHYTAKPSEVSIVDNPCLSITAFQFVRADGQIEMRKFAQHAAAELDKAKKKIQAVIGHLKGETTTTVQTIIFSPTSEWDAASCKAWLKEHDFKASGVDETEDSYRYRQRDPGDFEEGSFRTINFKGGKKTMANKLGKVDAAGAKLVIDATREACVAILEKKAKELKKDMYDVGRLADVLTSLAYITMSAKYEAEREDDESALPEKLQEELEGLAEAFLSMAEEEVKELTQSASEAGKGGMYMAVQATGLQKAASVKEHVAKMVKAHQSFHAKMRKAHDDREAEHAEHIEKLHKILGSEEAGGEAAEEPESKNPASEGAPSNIKAAGGLDLEKLLTAIDTRMQEGIAKGVDTAMQALMTGIMGEERAAAILETAGDNAHAAKTAAATLGNRQDADSKRAPKVTVVRKADDVSTTGQGAPVVETKKADIEKAAAGSVADILTMMKNVEPKPVSEFVQGHLSKLAK